MLDVRSAGSEIDRTRFGSASRTVPDPDPLDEPKSTDPTAGAATADPAPANTVIALSATAATSVLDECIALLVR